MSPKYRWMAVYGGLGFELAISVVVGLFGGRWLDGKFGTGNAFTLAGLVLGAAAGFRALYRAGKNMQRDAEREEEEERRRLS